MSMSESFLSVDTRNEEKCLLCQKTISEKEKIKFIADNVWEKFKKTAVEWSNIKIDSYDECEMKTNQMVKYTRIVVSNLKLGFPIIGKNMKIRVQTKLQLKYQ